MGSFGQHVVRQMRRPELDVLVGWAADEGWNPGLDDAEVFWATDPDGFVALEDAGALIGGGSIVSYDGRYGFMGFFIVHPDHRGGGLGRTLWFERRRRLQARLATGAAIEMDGVFDMQPFYAAGGFVEQHRDLRFQGLAAPTAVRGGDVVDLAGLPFAMIDDYDRSHFPAPRPAFLRRWVARPGGQAVGVTDGTRLRGYAVSRPCRVGHRIGPLFADDPAVAASLFASLTERLAGETVALDVPERIPHALALALARGAGLVEVFGCARMTLGPPPPLPWNEIYGVTTLELG